MSVINLLNRANFNKVNGICAEGPPPMPTFLAPVISRLRMHRRDRERRRILY